MTGRLSRTGDLIRSQLLKHQLGTVIPRGIAWPLDKFLSGIQRFARPIGSSFPVLTPRNTVRLSSSINQGEVSFYVRKLLPNIPVGSIISFQGEELQFVEDVDEENNLIKISGEEGVLSSYPVGTPVYLHAVPCTMQLAASSGDTSVTVESDVIIVHGDVMTEVLEAGVGGSSVDNEVSDLTVIQEEIGDPFLYTLDMQSGLLQDYSVGDTIYLRAYPAYKSRLIPLPTQPGSITRNIGPFLWDFIEGRLHDGIQNNETGAPDPKSVLALTTYSPSYYKQGERSVKDKNTVHIGAVIPSHFFGLWDRHDGLLRYEGESTTIQVDEDGDFLISHRLVPAWPGGNRWYIGFSSDEDVQIRVGFHLKERPDGTPALPTAVPGTSYTWEESLQTIFFDFEVEGGAPRATSKMMETPALEFDKITIGGHSESSDCRITFRDWHPFVGIATWVEYTVMGRAEGDYSWAGSGLILKPIFLNRDYLQISNRLDSGLVFF